MKKILFFLFVLGVLIPTTFISAQNKKVAILETVDKEGNISYAHKLMLRSNLAKAITRTPGYEAYDRTDMDAIMGEHNFQRTGMVSDDQIKMLGEMTGAAYILVAEAVKVDDANMFITAKILNVETARTEMSDNVLMGTDATQIQEGCIELASKLFGVSMNASTKHETIETAQQTPQKTNFANNVENRQTETASSTPVKENTAATAENTAKKSTIANLFAWSSNKDGHRKEHKKDGFGFDKAIFYGVDYSNVHICGTKESPVEFPPVFPLINNLLVKEYDKYIATLEKSIKVEMSSVQLEYVIQKCESINPRSIVTYEYSKEGPGVINDEAIKKALTLCNIPQRDGYGIIVFAVLLSEANKMGYYQLVAFDNKTMDIIVNHPIKGETGGSKLRNYWANSLCDAFGKIKLKDIIVW